MIRTLIVEDDPMVADLAAGYLARIEGFALEDAAASGEQALEVLRARQVHLVLLDVFMPGMDGMELLHIIKSQFPHTDVIMITAAQSSREILSAVRQGVADYIVKPFSFERFRESLLQFQEKRRLLLSTDAPFTQEMLDKRIFIKKNAPQTEGSPKGIDPQTLAAIIAVLRIQKKPFSLKEITPLTGLSRISLKKYFVYLQETSRLGSAKDYGGQGRPVTRYIWLG